MRLELILELIVDRVTRGKIKDINTHKAYVEARHNGVSLMYWTIIEDAPQVGTTLEVQIKMIVP